MKLSKNNAIRFVIVFFSFIFQLTAFQNCTSGYQSLNDSSLSPSSTPSNPNSLDASSEAPSIPPESPQQTNRTSADFGVVGDCVKDDTEALQKFFNVGGLLKDPTGACYRVTQSIKIPSNITVIGEGQSTLIKLIPPEGTRPPIVPVLDLAGSGTRTTAHITLSNFAVDGGYVESAFGGAGNFSEQAINNDGMAPAILVQSNDSVLANLWVSNAYDNGIGVYQTGCDNPLSQCNNEPKRVKITGISCFQNGYGGKKLGGCVDLLTARDSTVSDSVDHNSSSGFILDYWGGAQGTFRNLKAYNNRLFGFYIGASGSVFENLESHGAGKLGVWIDGFADNSTGLAGTIKNLTIRNPKQSAIELSARGWQLIGVDISGVTPNIKQAAIRYTESYLPNDKVIPNPANFTEITGINASGRILSFYKYSGFKLEPGQRFGDNMGQFFLIMQTDGNLVLYKNSGGLPLWSSNTASVCGPSNCTAIYKKDGYFIIQNQQGQILSTLGSGSELHFSETFPFLTIVP